MPRNPVITACTNKSAVRPFFQAVAGARRNPTYCTRVPREFFKATFSNLYYPQGGGMNFPDTSGEEIAA